MCLGAGRPFPQPRQQKFIAKTVTSRVSLSQKDTAAGLKTLPGSGQQSPHSMTAPRQPPFERAAIYFLDMTGDNPLQGYVLPRLHEACEYSFNVRILAPNLSLSKPANRGIDTCQCLTEEDSLRGLGQTQCQAAGAGPAPKVSPSSPASHGNGCDGANSPYSASWEMSFS